MMPALLRYFLLAVAGMIIIGIGYLLNPGHAVSLEITGLSTGAGQHSLSFAGDLINASITQGNNSTWLINATGASA